MAAADCKRMLTTQCLNQAFHTGIKSTPAEGASCRHDRRRPNQLATLFSGLATTAGGPVR